MRGKNAFYKSSPMRGISLITLVITIIVVIILAGAVILSLANNNPIETANEAVFRSDISEIQSQLDLYITGQYADNLGTFDESQVNGKISDYLPSVTKYDSELKIENGKLVYIGTDEKKIEIARDMGVIIETDEDEEPPVSDSNVVEVSGLKFNRPDIEHLPEATTKAVKWDTSNNETEIELSTAKTETDWYDYSTKKWANIYTDNNNNKAYWVWIPRYAYKIDHPHTATAEQIHIIFLSGTSDNPADGSTLSDGYIVHPAFTFDGKELTGIWVAKYEASSSDPNKVETTGYTGGGNTATLQVRVLPSVYSWRNISNENVQTVSINMVSSQGSIGTTTNLDTHQMKNIEWGAVAYLSQSQYGEEPWVNPYGDGTTGSWKMKTGYAGTDINNGALAEGSVNLHPYNDLIYGVNASTTHNIYGVYDMSGGALEKTASLINNGNSNIGTYGGIYTENNKIKSEYEKYYDIYEPGDEEKEGSMYYGTAGTTLWNSGYTEAQNIIRKRLTDETYAKFENRKGDALWEISNGNSYYGRYTDTGTYNWLTSTSRIASQGAQYAIGWNGDYMLVGHALLAWFYRGGYFGNGSYAGLFSSNVDDGDPSMSSSFRPVLISGLDL